ncbi:SacI homology domain-containing protein [Chytriomyces sp. MP71]|nr:SacI homology domain-containing protein [Chytriomyces sp. MP71]
MSRSSNESFRVVTTHSGRVVVGRPVMAASCDGMSGAATLTVTDTRTTLSGSPLPSASESVFATDAFAVVGIADLCFAKYVLVVTHRTLAATVQAHKIWRVTRGKAIPVGVVGLSAAVLPVNAFEAAAKLLNEEDLAKYTLDMSLLESLLDVLNSGHIYYSTTYDLTHSVQHNYFSYNVNPSDAIVDDRYFFNRHFMRPILDLVTPAAQVPWVYKMICGYAGGIDIPVAINPAMPQSIFTTVLISRLSTLRLGTRYVRRGLDLEGNAANSVEMEQIVFHHDFQADAGISSFVQLRGSAPLVWTQERDLKYRPELNLADPAKLEVWASIQEHFADLRTQYIGDASVAAGRDFGKVVCVNLLDDSGFEGALSKAYEAAVDRFAHEKVVYEDFPLNKWCRKMNFKNMSVLVDHINKSLMNSQFFVAFGDVPFIAPTLVLGKRVRPFAVSKIQTGVTRVSCLDSLDRTNLTCSVLASYMLPYQIHSLLSPEHAKPPVKPISSLTSLTSDAGENSTDELTLIKRVVSKSTNLHTNLWADSGDAVSLLYAGTRALKSDVTRTGSRQWVRGSLDDGLNSLTRYYLNNFSDGRKQDAYDVWTGKIASAGHIWKALGAESAKRARAVAKPVLQKGRGISGVVLPKAVIDNVEPFLQETSGFVAQAAEMHVARMRALGSLVLRKTIRAKDGNLKLTNGSVPGSSVDLARVDSQSFEQVVTGKQFPNSFAGFIVATTKIYTPKKVTNVYEFMVAMIASLYLVAVSRLLRIKGTNVVDQPRLIDESDLIEELEAH